MEPILKIAKYQRAVLKKFGHFKKGKSFISNEIIFGGIVMVSCRKAYAFFGSLQLLEDFIFYLSPTLYENSHFKHYVIKFRGRFKRTAFHLPVKHVITNQ